VESTIKLVSGFILFVVGVLIAYETSVYNLIDILLIVGLIIAIVGIILIIGYFVDSNADRTTNAIKDFINSKEFNSAVFNRLDKQSGPKHQTLHVRRDFNEYDDTDYDELVFDDDYMTSSPSDFLGRSYEDNSKAVLRVPRGEEKEIDLDKQLTFTPPYETPSKVTRAPKKREEDYFVNDSPEFIVETDKSEEIRRALSEDDLQEPVLKSPKPIVQEVNEPRDIKID
jgi:flagellar basal body-associated protein FliL